MSVLEEVRAQLARVAKYSAPALRVEVAILARAMTIAERTVALRVARAVMEVLAPTALVDRGPR